MTVRILTNARLVLADRVLDDGWLAIRDGVIDALDAGEPPGPGRFPGALVDYVDVERHWVLPGYVDLHCHGGGGRPIYSGDIEDVRVAAAAHLDRGTTSMLASVASARLETMIAAAESIGAAIDDGSAPNVRGIHFEGPFLSPERRGAQTGSALLPPDEGVFRTLLRAAGGHAASMTIAPELPGALDLIRRHHDDLVFCVGHTDAGADTFQSAVDAGARHVTHLFNAMPGLTHRHPGPVARALLDPRVTVELIADGHHLAPDTLRLALATAGSARAVLVTDAMAAAGMPDGRYDFVDRSVDVRAGAAYLHGTDTLAGSTLFLAEAAARVATLTELSPVDTARLTATNAARVLGWSDRGVLAPGAAADLVVSPDGAHASAVAIGGHWRPAATSPDARRELAIA
jgi:N-acetylglucosamine-6-phosphate deacetylase